MVEIRCEWDIGSDGIVFTSRQVAEKWLHNNWPDSIPETWPEAEDEGLLDFRTLTVISA